MYLLVPRVIRISSSNAGTAVAHGIQARAVATAAGVVMAIRESACPNSGLAVNGHIISKEKPMPKLKKNSRKSAMPAAVRRNTRGLILLLVGVILGTLIVVGQQ